jgi:hypothetical protein
MRLSPPSCSRMLKKPASSLKVKAEVKVETKKI